VAFSQSYIFEITFLWETFCGFRQSQECSAIKCQQVCMYQPTNLGTYHVLVNKVCFIKMSDLLELDWARKMFQK
jgi:hypothetical protein